jgi:hypothetical protein
VPLSPFSFVRIIKAWLIRAAVASIEKVREILYFVYIISRGFSKTSAFGKGSVHSSIF